MQTLQQPEKLERWCSFLYLKHTTLMEMWTSIDQAKILIILA